MTRRQAVGAGLAAGAGAGLLLLVVFILLVPREGADEARQADAVETAAEADASGDAPSEAAPEDEAGPAAGVKTLPVTVYQRAGTGALALKPAGARIVWFDSPVERARQLVRHVIDGVRAEGAVQPGPRSLSYREVYIDDNRTAWVDLASEGAAKLAGADMEEAVVACLTRTLVDNLEEVQRVGILVDGEPRTTLAGHVDISRTFTGREWPTR